MCGITGFLDFDHKLAPDSYGHLVGKMSESLRSRGPDDSGEWVDTNVGIALGHRRLAIIDLSPLGHQPMVSASGRYVIVFNGEVYNFLELRKELESVGVAFKGSSDTEVILEVFDRWGVEESIKLFNGMFAIALWDRKERVLSLMRDRLGIKPLYYGWLGKTFVFASELKAIRLFPEFNCEIDRNSLALFFRFNCIPGPYSIYKGIFKLPVGSYLTLSNAAQVNAPVAYWSANDIVQRGLDSPLDISVEDALEQLEILLTSSVKRRMISDVPLGALLSGGIDSSTITALMQSCSAKPVKTFTIGYDIQDFNEAGDAKAVAKHLGTDHTELYVSAQDAREVIPELPHIYDEPFSDASQIPTYLVSRLVRKYVTVCLSGDGGDELFGGYNRHIWVKKIWKSIGWMPRIARRAISRSITTISPASWDKMFNALGRGVKAKRNRQRNPGEKLHKIANVISLRNPHEIYYALLSHWHNPASVVLNSKEPPVSVTERESWPEIKEFQHHMMYIDLINYLPDDILTKVDRASMAVSLELRVPFLDHNVVEYAWRMPLQMKIRKGVGKWPLRKILQKHVPKELVDRPKAGFGIPIVDWLRTSLRDWAEELLDERRMRNEGFLNPEPIRAKWKEHLSGKYNWQYHLWDVLMFQAWLVDQKSPVSRG